MDTPFDNYIQTDATINHGNSPGPLINQEGKIVGIDTALFNPVGQGFIGIGFAIPASTVRAVLAYLLDPNHAPPGWLGFKLQDMTGPIGGRLGGAVSHRRGCCLGGSVGTGSQGLASVR